jgi:hypothetical protein
VSAALGVHHRHAGAEPRTDCHAGTNSARQLDSDADGDAAAADRRTYPDDPTELSLTISVTDPVVRVLAGRRNSGADD